MENPVLYMLYSLAGMNIAIFGMIICLFIESHKQPDNHGKKRKQKSDL
jgi:hypothetical protein